MLAELEVIHGWDALCWAFGGFTLLIKHTGGTMKNALYWLGLLAVVTLIGWLSLEPNRTLWIPLGSARTTWLIGPLAVAVIAFAFWRPKLAIPAALLIASSIPLAQLISVYINATRLVQVMNGGFSGTITRNGADVTGVLGLGDARLKPLELVVTGDGLTNAGGIRIASMDTWLDSAIKTLGAAPSVERLITVTVVMTFIAVLIALGMATIRTRFARAKPAA
jgi:hypothetical protein